VNPPVSHATTPNGTAISVVDAQVHLNFIGGVEAGLAAMNAVGVDRVIIDEWWGFDEHGARKPSYRLADGAVRHEYPLAVEAAMRYPERFSYTGWVDRRDPDLDSVVARIRANPHQPCIRLVIRPQDGEDAAFRAGDYDRLLAAAQSHEVPVMACVPTLHLPQRTELLVPRFRKFHELQFIIDHCGVLPLSDDDVARNFARPESLDLPLAFAEFANVAIKWSLAPMLSDRPFPYADLLPYLRRFIDAFGAERIMWASDNTQIKTSCWAQLLYYLLLTESLSDNEKDWILSKTARNVFALPAAET
jgi:predicted TIM-barrel fold metal-dependent hydrolase